MENQKVKSTGISKPIGKILFSLVYISLAVLSIYLFNQAQIWMKIVGSAILLITNLVSFQLSGTLLKLGNIRYYFVMIAILISELGLIALFYLFATTGQLPFAIFTVVLFIAIIAYLIINGINERLKLKPAKEVRKAYLTPLMIVLIVIFCLLAGAILIKAIMFTIVVGA